jgi:hypothetical protein
MKPHRFAAFAAAALIAIGAHGQEALRPDVGKPLQAAQELIKASKYKEALAKVRDADAVANKNANESYMVERMRIAAASGAGEVDTAAKSFEVLAASGRVSAADKARMAESIAGGYYRNKDYAKSMQWGQRYFKEGGASPAIRTLLIQSQYLSGDFAGAARELTTEIQTAEKSGTAPAQERLNLLLNAATQLKDQNITTYALERLVTYYPRKEYWVDLLSRMQRKPGFSDRLVLDTYRLSLATGSMSSPADFMEMGQLALQAGASQAAARPDRQAHRRGQGWPGRCRTAGPRREGRQCACRRGLRDLARRRQRKGAAADAAGHRQGRAEAPGGRQAASGHGAGHGWGRQGAGHAALGRGQRRHRRSSAAVEPLRQAQVLTTTSARGGSHRRGGSPRR